VKQAITIIAAGFLAAVFIILGAVFLKHFAIDQNIGEIRYVDLISIILTALSIMITIFGLFLAVLGVIGWATFESKLRANSLSYLTAELSKEGKLRKEFEAILTEISLRGVRPEEQPTSLEPESSERPYND
jgi:magnesium-transporting ATPase (P-type)